MEPNLIIYGVLVMLNTH